MGTPAAVMGDQINASCPIHLIPNPATGAPQPSPVPMPFSAPITLGTVPTVLISGQPAAVEGSSGMNTPPHVGLHPADPYMVPLMQIGQVAMGSPTVLIGGMGAASESSQCMVCGGLPGTLAASGTTVLIGP
ncbi:MAG TPA: PAAR domain-containing protein [Acidimicrobiales bacterium]|nr:PAAR domain-containing protein [Acidimicrobiales bacterium]